MDVLSQLHCGDCRDVMAAMSEASVDAVVCDPPYGLEFMGKGWDQVVPGPDYWTAALRVLKPGGHLLAFGGTRTFHRLVCAIEDSGFEIRDTLQWVYGSGFPKSHDVSKAIDKAGSSAMLTEETKKAFAKELREARTRCGVSKEELSRWFPNYSEVTKNWERMDDGFRVPSQSDLSVLIDRLNLPDHWAETLKPEDKRETIASALQDRRGDGSVYSLGHSGAITAPSTDLAKTFSGYGTALKPCYEPICLAMKPLDGTYAQNAIQHGLAGLNIDACRIGDFQNKTPSGVDRRNAKLAELGYRPGEYQMGKTIPHTPPGRWPGNFTHDGSDEVLELFPQQKSGGAPKSRNSPKTKNAFGEFAMDCPDGIGATSGSAARFFYCAKASKSDRGEGNTHPTVKPQALMEWLIKLVSPPIDPVILDPFAGSGSTLVAAKNLGIRSIGIEMNPEYCDIIRSRLKSSGGLF